MKKLSVVLATHRRGDGLKALLDSLQNQETKGRFSYEVIVVENDAKPQSQQLVESYGVKYLQEPVAGKCRAINRGIAASEGEIVAFTDDDVEADRSWLLNLLDCFESAGCDGVGGRVLPVYPQGTPQWVKDNAVQLAGAVVIYDQGPQTKELGAGQVPFIGANFAFRRSVFTDCGMFKDDWGPGTAHPVGEDSEFVERVLSKGKKLLYCGAAVINHPFDPRRLTLRHMARWHIALGKLDAYLSMQKGESFVYYFGVPRYLVRGACVDFLKIMGGGFRGHLMFINAWRGFWRQIGMIGEFRRARQSKAGYA